MYYMSLYMYIRICTCLCVQTLTYSLCYYFWLLTCIMKKYEYHKRMSPWINDEIQNKFIRISTVYQYPFLKLYINSFSKILLNTIQILKLNYFEFILYIWRKSQQAHIPHTPLLLDNDTNKKWQGKL